MTVYEYEVELAITNANAQTRETVTRTEFAYGPIDAMLQATMNQAAVAGSAKIDVLHVGPPRRLVDLATQELQKGIAETLKRLAGSLNEVPGRHGRGKP